MYTFAQALLNVPNERDNQRDGDRQELQRLRFAVANCAAVTELLKQTITIIFIRFAPFPVCLGARTNRLHFQKWCALG